MVERSSSFSGPPAPIKTTPRSHCGRYAKVSGVPAAARESEPGSIHETEPACEALGTLDHDTHDAFVVRGIVNLADKIRQAFDGQPFHTAIGEVDGEYRLGAVIRPYGNRRDRIDADR